MKVAVVGAGNLGRLMADRLAEHFDVVAIDKVPEALSRLSNPVVKRSGNIDSIRGCDVVVLCVKPADIPQVLDSMPKDGSTLFVSCAAGVPLSKIKSRGISRASRVMPNINIKEGFGVIAFCGEDVSSLFSGIGMCIRMDEDKLNTVTAISGSGVAYFWYFARAFESYALASGISKAEAGAIIGQVLKGCGEMVLRSGATLDELIASVATPNGTTAAGLDILGGKRVDKSIITALEFTEKRCRDIEKSTGIVRGRGKGSRHRRTQ